MYAWNLESSLGPVKGQLSPGGVQELARALECFFYHLGGTDQWFAAKPGTPALTLSAAQKAETPSAKGTRAAPLPPMAGNFPTPAVEVAAVKPDRPVPPPSSQSARVAGRRSGGRTQAPRPSVQEGNEGGQGA
jgi:hypothetical protein